MCTEEDDEGIVVPTRAPDEEPLLFKAVAKTAKAMAYIPVEGSAPAGGAAAAANQVEMAWIDSTELVIRRVIDEVFDAVYSDDSADAARAACARALARKWHKRHWCCDVRPNCAVLKAFLRYFARL
jgi:hypothetical protein